MIRTLDLHGTPFEMGLTHGRAVRDEIRAYADERVRLAGDPVWSGRELGREGVLALAEACLDDHRAYAPDLFEEMRGVADASGLSLAELVVVGGFTDFIDTVYNVDLGAGAPPARPAAPTGADDCTAFLVPRGRGDGGAALFGQTWDMHADSAEHVVMLRGRPEDAPDFLVFTTAGCLGMIGMNSAGVVVGINNLLGADGGIGVTWPFVVRRMLAEESADGALARLRGARLAGAHNYLILDGEGRGYDVEAMTTELHVEPLAGEALVHTNHCLTDATRAVERERDAAAQAASELRLEHAAAALARGGVTPDDLQALTRDEGAVCVRPRPPRDVATCGAVVARPATLDFWAVQGLPSENEYEHHRLA